MRKFFVGLLIVLFFPVYASADDCLASDYTCAAIEALLDLVNAPGITDNALMAVDDADAEGNDFAKFTVNGLEGRSYAEVKSDLDLEIGTDVLAEQTIGIADDNLVETDDAVIADNDYAKFTANGLEGRSYAEVRTDLSLEQLSDCSGITGGFCLDTDDGIIYVWDGDSVENFYTPLAATIEEETHTSEHAIDGDDSVFPTDPNVDGILLWDDTPGTMEWASIGAGLSYDGATLTASASATAYDDIANPDASGSIAMGAFTGTYTSDTDGWGGLIINLGVNDATATTTGLTIQGDDADDEDVVFLSIIENASGTPANLFRFYGRKFDVGTNAQITGLDSIDLGGATSLEMPNSTDPDVDAVGEITHDDDGANEANDETLRGYDGANQFAWTRKIECIQATVISPNELVNAERDRFPMWANNTGMVFTITEIKGWSDTDDTTLNPEIVTDTNWTTRASICTTELEIATDGTGVFTGVKTAGFDNADIQHDETITLDFDDTDTPGVVQIAICGWFNADID